MLNSLYGRFGLKYISSRSEVVTTKKAKEIALKYQVVENEKLDNNLEYIKYNISPNEPLFHIDESLYTNIKIKCEKESNTIIRSVGIAAMVTTNALIYMDKFLNLPDNKCYYTDTDSGFFEKPLDPKYIGDNIGQFKYEGLVKRGYFISPKLYCLVMDNGKTIIKSKGVPSKYLTEQDFISMLHGKSINLYLRIFKKNLKNLNISHINTNIKITHQMLKRIPIYNEKNIIIDSIPFKVINGILINK
jgi:hypothetical protein